ncbi:MAG TPA: acyl-CoA dehydrogenase family protein [Syntrophales bacterium]|nr:acyl-CoA dehydrogenase family protein [Syntrophales bacterium]
MYDFMLNDEARAIRDKVRVFAKNEVDPEYLKRMDRDEIRFPRELYEKYAGHKLLGLRFPREYGGQEMSWAAECAAMEEIGCLGTAAGCAYVMPSIVGEAINKFGTAEQKIKYLKPMLEGKLVSAEALTEPRGGSDFFGASSRAEDKGDHFLVRGTKRFIVGAEGADFFLVYVRTNPDPNASPYQRISTMIIDRSPGVEVKYLYGLMGTRGGGTGRVVFRDVKVPKSNLIGPLHGGALVFNTMMIPERLCSAAPMTGGMKSCLDVAMRYADKRKAFGRPIRKFQAVNFQIAEAQMLIDASRAMIYQAARAADEAAPSVRRIVSETKKFVTESAWDAVNKAMQITGGIGYTDVYPIERALRDTRLAQIWTGTNEIMSAMVQHDIYEEFRAESGLYRDFERDAMHADESEKIFDDDDMWRVFEKNL